MRSCEMDEERIHRIIEMIEGDIGAAEGKSRIVPLDAPRLVSLTANQTGLLRLVCTLLRATTEPILPDDCRSRAIEIGSTHLHQVGEDQSDLAVVFVQRMETWPEPTEIKNRRCKSRMRDRVVLWGCGLVAFILIAIFTAGVATIWRLVGRLVIGP